MKRCAQCHGKLGLGIRARNVGNGRWWVRVRFCSTYCEALYELQRRSALFIEAMADPSRRRIAFNVVERNCRDQFAEADDGISLYLHLLGYVRSACIGSSRCSIKSFGNRPVVTHEDRRSPRPAPARTPQSSLVLLVYEVLFGVR
jgi:hypothetical protein